nr:CHAT domain-containing protein [Candidatus Thiodictyon syntrophicum]
MALPWELLHDADAYLFQGARPTRVRRRLPNTRVLEVPAVATPIRILLVSARPEDEACGYIDHRVSALPLVDAMEDLGGLVDLQILEPATLPALRAALNRAQDARAPFHVVHFDGHGTYDRQVGLGGLCFEDPRDGAQLERRRHSTVYTDALGPLLRDHRIPLVFLEACQSAEAQRASESVASELLKVGVASVVAMSHSVLVETARRFVLAFYAALAAGRRVGDAMLAGQCALKDDDFRGTLLGAGDLRLEDWFVPVLFQEKADPRLFTAAAARVRADLKLALRGRLGAVPAPPETGFIGRSRDLLALERLLSRGRWAVIRGQGGEGKTVLAAELALWLVRTRRVERAAFVSVERHGRVGAVLDAIGRQLVGADYSVAAFKDLELAILPVERALVERSTLLVIDNMESVLLPPFIARDTPPALTEEARLDLTAILALCARLAAQGETRLVFTSRESLPAPFAAADHRRELHRLDREDAVRLVEKALGRETGGAGAAAEAARTAIEQLVESVHGHARTLALLAPALRDRGVEATHRSLVELMVEMERRFSGEREQSVFAGVELSLRRMSAANRERALVLGVFHGGVQLVVLRLMMGWEEAECAALGDELIGTGLATADPYNHLTLNPALCPYLRRRLDPARLESLTAGWGRAMGQYVGFLEQQQHQNTEVAATLTGLELPNLFALLDQVRAAGDAAATIDLTTSLYSLLRWLGRPRLLGLVGQVRDAAALALGDGSTHAGFEAQRTRIEQQLAAGRLREALAGAETLLQRARAAGVGAYPGADYDLAMACFLLARVLETAGGAEPALPLLAEARQGFESISRVRDEKAAEGMTSACITERGDCLLSLGRLDEAATAYEEGICRDEQRGADRDVAIGKLQLGTVRLQQGRYPEALAAYADARERFTQLDEPGTVATAWHQTGMASQEAGEPEAAEDAYRNSLAIEVRLGDVAGQADTLGQLGNLYNDVLDRPEEAVAFYRQAADKYVEIGDPAKEGAARNNLALALRGLRRFDEARREVRRAIECKAPFGHASEHWTTWGILADLETDAGDPGAAAEARGKAIDAYLAYRRDGGENHDGPGRLALAVTQPLLAGDPAAAASLLQQFAARPALPEALRPFIQSLQAICSGSRDRALAATPGLDYTMAAECLLLIETLEAAGR